ncbi:MAG: hypothetical protein IJW55_07500 [Clostridia bacterium]|nr:hypothetical protein [Clostridia bacterium]
MAKKKMTQRKPIPEKMEDVCINILEKMYYAIPPSDTNHFWGQICVLICSVVTLVLSVISIFFIDGVDFFLFVFYTVGLFYKWWIAFIQARNYNRTENADRCKPSRKIATPYHKQSSVLFFILLMEVIFFAVSFFPKSAITLQSAYFIVALFSTLVTFFQEILDGLVSLYDARVSVKYITSK